MTPHGHVNWTEFVTRDPERTKAFYAATIGWTYDAKPMADGTIYWLAMVDAVPVAGIFHAAGDGYAQMADNWMPYIAVDDVDARVAKAVAAGAQLMRPIFNIPDVGRLAILLQPGGAGVGWITPVR